MHSRTYLPQPGLDTTSDDYWPATTSGCRRMDITAAAAARATRMSLLWAAGSGQTRQSKAGGLLAWTTSTLHGPPSGGQCAPLAIAEALLCSGHCLAAGSCRLLAVAPPLLRCLRLPTWLPSITTIFPTGEPITSPARAAHKHICGLDKTPPP